MDKETLKALNASIAHWENNLKAAKAIPWDEVGAKLSRMDHAVARENLQKYAFSAAGSDCALCGKFSEKRHPDSDGFADDERTIREGVFPRCYGCPVSQRTGKPDCRSSPYASARFPRKQGGEFLRDEWIQAIDDEVTFLKSLLPQEGE